MRPQWNIAVIGECMIELYRKSGRVFQSFGGDTFNMAAYLARICGQEARVEYVSAVGDDLAFSGAMLDFWHTCGVRSTLTQRIPGKLPGLYAIEVDDAGERQFQYWRQEAAARECFQTAQASEILTALAEFDHIHLSGISLAVLYPESRENLLARLEELTARGTAISFDFNYRPRLWGATPAANALPHYQRLARICQTVFLSLDEAGIMGCDTTGYTPQLIEGLRALGAREVVVKDGGNPCMVICRTPGDEVTIPLPAMLTPLDSTAAGDSFAAGYLAARKHGFDAVEAVSRAHILASAVIMHRGAIIPQEAIPNIFTQDLGPSPDNAACNTATV